MDAHFSPWDTRYAKDIPWRLSEEASTEAQVEVEAAWLLALMDEGLCPKMPAAELKSLWNKITFEEVAAFEARTQHATRALVEALRERLIKAQRNDVANWVHVGMTSFDCVDTAARLRVKRYLDEDAKAALDAFAAELRRLALRHKDLVAVGRTHGQFAVPTLFGLAFAEAHERLTPLRAKLVRETAELRGQASGAVGGYHASSLLGKDALALEKRFLAKIGLTPHYGSIQILPPEDLVAVVQTMVSIGSIAAKVAGDLRHLARSEIGEVAEGFSAGQVGSSTMPQKRNPWNLEHVCSLFKVALSRLQLVESDVVTEHQRDLTNSASGRFYVEAFIPVHLMLKRLTKVLAGLSVIEDQVAKNLKTAGDFASAEALYVMAAKAGEVDAHEKVREGARRAEASQGSLIEALRGEPWLPPDMNAEKLRELSLAGSRAKWAAMTASWPK